MRAVPSTDAASTTSTSSTRPASRSPTSSSTTPAIVPATSLAGTMTLTVAVRLRASSSAGMRHAGYERRASQPSTRVAPCVRRVRTRMLPPPSDASRSSALPDADGRAWPAVVDRPSPGQPRARDGLGGVRDEDPAVLPADRQQPVAGEVHARALRGTGTVVAGGEERQAQLGMLVPRGDGLGAQRVAAPGQHDDDLVGLVRHALLLRQRAQGRTEGGVVVVDGEDDAGLEQIAGRC